MKNMKGITLIALVITIVVLIILAGVAISLSVGENGIFNKAKYASETYSNEQEKEKIEIGKYPNQIDSYVGGLRTESTNLILDYENGVDLKSTLNAVNTTYTVPENGYLYVSAALKARIYYYRTWLYKCTDII